MKPAPTLLYVDCRPDDGIEGRRLAGMRRYAAGRGWRVETLELGTATPDALREALDRLHPVGCVAECWEPEWALPPAAFGKVPVVYFSPLEGPRWRHARSIECDEAAVARMAFRELSADEPPAYAVVTFWKKACWARERVEAFLACCREAGADCTVSCFSALTDEDRLRRAEQMVPWAAALPHRCAVFAVNDWCAHSTALALSKAGRPFPRTVTLVGADGAGPTLVPGDFSETVSSIRLDHEQAGYLAAKALSAFAAKEGSRKREMKGGSQMEGRASREIMGAACAANSFGGKAATLHCGEAAPSLPAGRAPSLPPQAATPSLQRWEDGTAVFPPLLVDRRPSTRGHGRREPHILKAMDMIRREACDGLTAAVLAGRFHGSRRLFDLRFREAMGHSPLDEILNVRLERAMELLVRTDLPVAVVAQKSGFQSEGSFWKLFKKRTGLAPLPFRKARR